MVLPVLLIAYDVSLELATCGRWTHWDWRAWSVAAPKKYGGYILVVIAYLAARAAVLGGFPLPPVAAVENPLITLERVPRLLTAIEVAGNYLALFIWPASLTADYSSNTIPVAFSTYDAGALWGVLAWGGLLGIGAWAFTREPRVFFAVVLTVLTYLPSSNVLVPIGTIMAERLFYLPSAGLCLLAGLGFGALIRWRAGGTARVAVIILVGTLCLALTLRTVIRNRDWKDGETLYRNVIETAPTNAKAYVFLGGALRQKKRYPEALEAYRTAQNLRPEYPRQDAHFNLELGATLFKLGHRTEAVEAFEQAVTLDPDWSRARNSLALAYASLDKYDKAEATLRYAITRRPDSPNLPSTLSLILNEQGRHQAALSMADLALRLDPTHPWALVNRGIALENLNRPEEARRMFERVVALRPAPEFETALMEARERIER